MAVLSVITVINVDLHSSGRFRLSVDHNAYRSENVHCSTLPALTVQCWPLAKTLDLSCMLVWAAMVYPRLWCWHGFYRKCLEIFTSPTVGMRSIAISVSACLSVYLFVCLLTSQKPHSKKVQISTNFPYILAYTCGRVRSSDDSAIRYVLPVLWMTSCFHVMERMDQNQRWRVGFI